MPTVLLSDGAMSNACITSAPRYEHRGHEPRSESDPLGDTIAQCFRLFDLRDCGERVFAHSPRASSDADTIARLCVPYGDGGWPFHLMMMRNGAPVDVHPDRPNRYNLFHVDDCIEKIPACRGRHS